MKTGYKAHDLTVTAFARKKALSAFYKQRWRNSRYYSVDHSFLGDRALFSQTNYRYKELVILTKSSSVDLPVFRAYRGSTRLSKTEISRSIPVRYHTPVLQLHRCSWHIAEASCCLRLDSRAAPRTSQFFSSTATPARRLQRILRPLSS